MRVFLQPSTTHGRVRVALGGCETPAQVTQAHGSPRSRCGSSRSEHRRATENKTVGTAPNVIGPGAVGAQPEDSFDSAEVESLGRVIIARERAGGNGQGAGR